MIDEQTYRTIIERYNNESLPKICNELGVSEKTVRRMSDNNKYGVSLKRKRIQKIDKETYLIVVERYENEKLADICSDLNISDSAVRHVSDSNKFGVKLKRKQLGPSIDEQTYRIVIQRYENETLSEICNDLGISEDAVRNMSKKKKYGLSLKKKQSDRTVINEEKWELAKYLWDKNVHIRVIARALGSTAESMKNLIANRNRITGEFPKRKHRFVHKDLSKYEKVEIKKELKVNKPKKEYEPKKERENNHKKRQKTHRPRQLTTRKRDDKLTRMEKVNRFLEWRKTLQGD